MKYYQKWEARAIRPDGISQWFEAEVPGNIQYDYGKFMGWGGSGINKNIFYDLCDRLGIMVWVEFPLACNNYRETEHYLKVLEQEATAIV